MWPFTLTSPRLPFGPCPPSSKALPQSHIRFSCCFVVNVESYGGFPRTGEPWRQESAVPCPLHPVFPVPDAWHYVVRLSRLTSQYRCHPGVPFPLLSSSVLGPVQVPCGLQCSYLLRLLWAETASQPFLIWVPWAAVPRTSGGFCRMPLCWGSAGISLMVTLGWGLRGGSLVHTCFCGFFWELLGAPKWLSWI